MMMSPNTENHIADFDNVDVFPSDMVKLGFSTTPYLKKEKQR
jgi:hypothetical protein